MADCTLCPICFTASVVTKVSCFVLELEDILHAQEKIADSAQVLGHLVRSFAYVRARFFFGFFINGFFYSAKNHP
jgi:hypothetical protein